MCLWFVCYNLLLCVCCLFVIIVCCLFVGRGYLVRFHKAGLKPGNTVYIIDGEWFKQWKKVAGYEV